MMKELLKDVEGLAAEEYVRANNKFPMFRSKHEGLAVLEEEIWESSADMTAIDDAFQCYKRNVFRDNDTEYLNNIASDIEHHALYGACELIQVAAMARKCIDSTQPVDVTNLWDTIDEQFEKVINTLKNYEEMGEQK